MLGSLDWRLMSGGNAPTSSTNGRLSASRRMSIMASIVVYGAGGKAGSRIVAEATRRGHSVLAVARDPARLHELRAGVRTAAGEATSSASLREQATGSEALVFAIGGPDKSGYEAKRPFYIPHERRVASAAFQFLAALERPRGALCCKHVFGAMTPRRLSLVTPCSKSSSALAPPRNRT